MAKPDRVIVLVPGGMGSTLSLGSVGVWDSTVAALAMVLDPALFLPWLALTPGSLVTVYDGFLSFLNNLGYNTGQKNLYLFPYDWRQGLPVCASNLVQFVNNKVKPYLGGKKILFISHSYGCMVTRQAILLSPAGSVIDPSVKIQGVVAAGPHMLGIPSSFRNLVAMPELSTAFDLLFGAVQILLPAYANVVKEALCRTLTAVTAMLESMPTYPILQGGSINPLPPFAVWNWAAWPPELQSAITDVQQRLLAIANTTWDPTMQIIVLMSASRPTDTGYVLGPDNQLLYSYPTALGDGAVLSPSATAYCSPTGQVVASLTYPHENLLDDPVGRNYLTSNNVI
jgi:pimeloyl-ACP methyl ester carboxylesterase